MNKKKVKGPSDLALFAKAAKISVSYASEVTSQDPTKRKKPSLKVALKIHKNCGRKFGLLEGATDEEVEAVKTMAIRTGFVEPY